jgi:TPR repeat protein
VKRWFTWSLLALCCAAGLSTYAGAGGPPELERLSALAAGGDPAAQYALGNAYAEGSDVPRDDAAAVKWLRAATASALPAEWRRGVLFLDLAYTDPYSIQPVDQHGPGGGMNDPVPVHYNMAVQLSQGLGCDSYDFEQAATHYREAAAAGYAPAQYNLALLYASGRGVAADQAGALRLFRQAASGGAASAMHAVAVAMLLGRGCAADSIESMEWLTRAAMAGHSAALCCRGVLRMSDTSLLQESKTGLADLEAAALAGNRVAQYDLGVAYADGHGTTRDLQQAIRWLRDAGTALPAQSHK